MRDMQSKYQSNNINPRTIWLTLRLLEEDHETNKLALRTVELLSATIKSP